MHCCPKSAACWSPASEAIGIGTGTCGQSVVPYTALVGTTSGQHRARDVEQVEQFVVPVEGVDVEEHRARGVRDVGDVEPPARKPPCEPRIDRAETEFALLGARVRRVRCPESSGFLVAEK